MSIDEKLRFGHKYINENFPLEKSENPNNSKIFNNTGSHDEKKFIKVCQNATNPGFLHIAPY